VDRAFPPITQLIPDLKSGDETSWNEVVCLFHAGLHGQALRLLKDSSISRRLAPDDLINIKFTKAWEKHSELRGATTFQVAKWLLTILHNTFVSECRPRNLEESIASWVDPHDSVTPSRIVADRDEQVIQQITLHANIAELDEMQRDVITLKHFEELTFREIADRLGSTIGKVANHHRQGLKILNERMGL